MPYANLNFNFPNVDRDQVMFKLEEIKTLMPFLINLNTADRKKGLKMGAATEKMFIDALFLIESNQQFVPQYVTAAEFVADIDAYIDLLAVQLKLASVLESVIDTRLALAQEMTPSVLALYSNIKQAAKANVPGSDTALQKLQPYFKKSKRKK